MLFDVALLIAGLTVLYFGAEFMVKGASQLALNLGISPFIVGMTVVAFGTSAPEFVVSGIATWQQSAGLSIGNIVGSNICNIALILGTAALISPLSVNASSLRREYPIMFASSVLFYIFALDGRIARWEGGILVVGIIGFVVYNMVMVRNLRKQLEKLSEEEAEKLLEAGPEVEMPDSDDEASNAKNIALLVVGIIGLAIGAQLMVEGAVEIAKAFKIPEFIIGITIIAFGTSLPELAASTVAALRKQSDISIGNVIGSNIFNVLFVIGLISLIFELPVEQTAISIDFPIMLGVMIIAFPLMRVGYQITRLRGAFLLLIYVAYTASLFLRNSESLPGS